MVGLEAGVCRTGAQRAWYLTSWSFFTPFPTFPQGLNAAITTARKVRIGPFPPTIYAKVGLNGLQKIKNGS